MSKNAPDVKIAPSILSADFARLGEEVRAIDEAGADYIHIDVMDGHFVPNLTFGPPIISAIRDITDKPFDVHLMIEKPEQYIEAYAKAGADIITVHVEAVTHLDRCLAQIKDTGAKVGVSLVPSTPPDVLDYVIDQLDLILVMSVNPGFGGQSFLPRSVEKLRELKFMIEETGKHIELEVDGGINNDTSELVKDAGATVLVAGSAIFKGNPEEYAAHIDALRYGNVVDLQSRRK